MDNAISVENLGKKYCIHHQSLQPYMALRDVIADRARAFGRRLFTRRSSALMSSREDFWALKDVSFKVKQGERIGIIGRNGAGKSTLLKILSRITEPTTGRVQTQGRIASLLEVGTGFHPELTGRENIFLNGAILGMNRAEIKTKFDEIVSFAETEKFLDTPVKRYSSGMYVRLAFAVAAHLEPEILIIDEVLAVGDAHFQKKCLGKMEQVGKEGRTLLFVSHNMGLIRQVCERGILLDGGSVLTNASIADAISNYLSRGWKQSSTEVDLTDHPRRMTKMNKILNKLVIKNGDDKLTNDFSQFETIIIDLQYDGGTTSLAGAGFIVYTEEGVRAGGGNTYMSFMPPHRIPSKGRVRFSIPARQFTPGTYTLTVSLGSHQKALEDKIEHAVTFSICQADIYGTGYLLTKEDGVATLSFQSHVEGA